jgi:hypothetical protein
MLFADFLELEAEIETGALPSGPDDIVTIDRLGELLAVFGGGDGNRGVRMRVVDMGARHEGVERRIDRGRTGIEIESRVGVHPDHGILDGGLRTLLGGIPVDFLQGEEFLLIEGGEILALGSAKVSAGTLDPQNLGRLAGEGILFGDLGGSIAAAGVGHPLVGAKQVGAVDELGNGIELGGYRVVPEVGQWGVFHGCRSWLKSEEVKGWNVMRVCGVLCLLFGLMVCLEIFSG